MTLLVFLSLSIVCQLSSTASLLDSFFDMKITLLASPRPLLLGSGVEGGEEEVERHHGAERRRDRAGTQ